MLIENTKMSNNMDNNNTLKDIYDSMTHFWYLCRDTGVIKWAGKFQDYDDCDRFLEDEGIDPVWIFSDQVQIEESR